MMALPLSRIAGWTGGRLAGADATVDAVSIDTRTLDPGDGRAMLFVALKGERFDGHDHAAAAVDAGARALLVSRALPLDVPQLVVADTERALGDFAAALQRAKEAVRQRQADRVNTRLSQLLDYLRNPAPVENTERILVKSSGEIFFLKADEIDWIEAEGDYMKFHVGGRVHLMRERMARLEARLDAKRFIRIHRSTIVNIDRMRKLSPSFAGEYAVILQDGTKLKLSRGYHERIATLLKQSL